MIPNDDIKNYVIQNLHIKVNTEKYYPYYMLLSSHSEYSGTTKNSTYSDKFQGLVNNPSFYDHKFNQYKLVKNNYISLNKKEYVLHFYDNIWTHGETWGEFITPSDTLKIRDLWEHNEVLPIYKQKSSQKIINKLTYFKFSLCGRYAEKGFL